jgi:hypothetical protein
MREILADGIAAIAYPGAQRPASGVWWRHREGPRHEERRRDDRLSGSSCFIRAQCAAQSPPPRPENPTEALYLAALVGSPAMAKEAIAQGASPAHRLENGITPAMVAAKLGSEAVLTVLLSHRIDLEQADDTGPNGAPPCGGRAPVAHRERLAQGRCRPRGARQGRASRS